MFKREKNIKDIQSESATNPGITVKDNSLVISYTKINKLITALYMVTDIIDKDEPLRNKLRTFGVEILSDISMSKMPFDILKIDQVMSFLDIAFAVNIISEMNYAILKKEFLQLSQSIVESPYGVKANNRQINLSEFFKEELNSTNQGLIGIERKRNSIGHYSNGHQYSTRIGVQKGSTLMKALSGVKVSEKNFNVLKKQRHDDIISIVKILGGNATIKDIKDRAQILQGQNGSLISCSEKTLQRELVFLVKDNVLNKVGEKRWSRYFLK